MTKPAKDFEAMSGVVGGKKAGSEHHLDGGHIQITNIKFNGSNSLHWLQSIRAYLRGRKKLDYITGANKEPKEDDPAFEDHTRRPHNHLEAIWLDLDTYHDYKWETNNDSTHYHSMVNKDCVFKFLSSLNDELDEVRGRIIAQKPLPKLAEAFSEVRREETRKRLMLGKKPVPLAENSLLQAAIQGMQGSTCNSEPRSKALATRRGTYQKTEDDPKAHLKCDHLWKKEAYS
ncbi:hypothetical protein LINGRAHAP2_LOCUS31522 [Linum grandiflorum]